MELCSTALSAFQACSIEMLVCADNIANVNTPGFQARSVSLTSGPRGEGVQVAAVHRNASSGMLIPDPVRLAGDADPTERANGYCEGSNTDVALEFVRMTAAQRAFEAGAACMRTCDEVAESLLNMKI